MQIINSLSTSRSSGLSMDDEVTVGLEVYHINFTEIRSQSDTEVQIPAGVLSGVFANYKTMQGGCYEIAFDLVSNIDNGTPFQPPSSNDPNKLQQIIDRAIFNHYNTYNPYCYVFFGATPSLVRLYSRIIKDWQRSNPNMVGKVHTRLQPEGRGYVIQF